ncbi:hypothetical protein RND71_001458 [Anisodus tanguticus]|uniref:tRNA (guanine(46)-N(7))-methyltransferase n=1 Tax=Anisodus tanguticus TaxID=243964 RepID=A0AAE1T2T9_9SOLA|nr:hypothetical protein RND71_001458 [Anisodus tanguticus]
MVQKTPSANHRWCHRWGLWFAAHAKQPQKEQSLKDMTCESQIMSQTLLAIRRSRADSFEGRDLNYREFEKEEDQLCQLDVGNLRIRQHVNPLRHALMIPAEAPNWKEVFEDATLPLMVDIGSVTFVNELLRVSLHRKEIAGSGRFLMWLAKRTSSSMNYLGLEIRPKLVTRAEYWVNELGLKNVHFISTNAMVSFQQLVSTYPGPLMLVSILCPDPHFKKKHHKRRVVQKPLVDSIVNNLAHGGQVFIQSDVLDVALDMRNYFDAVHDKLVHIDSVDPSLPCDGEGWVLNNPMGIRTEREIHAEFEGCKIYRRVYKKVQH